MRELVGPTDAFPDVAANVVPRRSGPEGADRERLVTEQATLATKIIFVAVNKLPANLTRLASADAGVPSGRVGKPRADVVTVFQGDFIYLVSDANGFNAQNAKFATYFVAEESG